MSYNDLRKPAKGIGGRDQRIHGRAFPTDSGHELTQTIPQASNGVQNLSIYSSTPNLPKILQDRLSEIMR
jgi:hypothetical protein